MPLCVITISHSQLVVLHLHKCLLSATPRTGLPETHNRTLQEPARSHKGLRRVYTVAQRPCPNDSLRTYCIFSPLTLTFDFKVDRSDPGNFNVETNQRHLDKKRTYYILWNARAHGGDTIYWRKGDVLKKWRAMYGPVAQSGLERESATCWKVGRDWSQIKMGRTETGLNRKGTNLKESKGAKTCWFS